MTIIFENELDTTFALSKNVTYRGRWNDELMWAEIDRKNGKFILRWEDNYMNKIEFNSEEAAREIVRRDHLMHRPHVNGASFDINGE